MKFLFLFALFLIVATCWASPAQSDLELNDSDPTSVQAQGMMVFHTYWLLFLIAFCHYIQQLELYYNVTRNHIFVYVIDINLTKHQYFFYFNTFVACFQYMFSYDMHILSGFI